MAAGHRLVLVASSVALLLLIALSLSTAIEIRGPPPKMIQITMAQAARLGSDDRVGAKAKLNGSDFDRGDVRHGTSVIPGITVLPTFLTGTQEGLIGFQPTPRPSASWSAEGVIGPIATPTLTKLPKPPPLPPAAQVPILALSYSGSGGPKHCRGNLLQKMSFPPPITQWKNGTCINLPKEARCGIFYAGKGDNCEAQLFNSANCYNTSETYVNTVVFMPEERPVGALWSSMFVRCGVEVPEAKLIDPSILGGLLKKPGKPGGG